MGSTLSESGASGKAGAVHDLLERAPFDASFSGWGWEDVDWALRVARFAPITHVDIPALHIGLDDAEALLRKSREGARNYARLAARHPREVRQFTSFRAAALLARAPQARRLGALAAWFARDPLGLTPACVRALALKAHRAALNCEALR
jgi:hypothetical protein